MPKTAVIVMSSRGLPTHKVGSWTQRYTHYLKNVDCIVTHIISPVSEIEPTENITKINIDEYSIWDKVKVKYMGASRFSRYLDALLVILKTYDSCLVQVIDNTGLVEELHRLLMDKRLRERVFIQYSYHGFPVLKKDSQQFYTYVDEMLFLTALSKDEHLKTLDVTIKRSTVVGNAIDTDVFKKMATQKRKSERLEKGIDHKTIFLFCSRDVPKKGLDVIIAAWEQLTESQIENLELWIIGSERSFNTAKNIISFGRKEPSQLPSYYQLADVFLFPTQCHEGYGLALAESICCGCSAIASNIGGVPEVVHAISNTELIDEYHNVDAWFQAIIKWANVPRTRLNIDENKINIMDVNQWSLSMNTIIKQSITSKNNV